MPHIVATPLPAERLGSDAALVCGVVRRGGRLVRIRARRGVLLAAGGFEHNAEMRRDFGVPGRVEDRSRTWVGSRPCRGA